MGLEVKGVMRRRWIAVSPLAAILDTLQLMRLARLRHLPVVKDGILHGLVSYPAIVTAVLMGQVEHVGQVMAVEAETAEASLPISEAVARIARNATGCLPVVEPTSAGPRLVGLLTESDLLRLAYEPGRAS
jgi:acetoin utilization protein AcuB